MAGNSPMGFDDIQERVSQWEFPAHPAEIQGVLTGVICGGGRLSAELAAKVVEEHMSAEKPFGEDETAFLHQIYQQVLDALADPQLGYHIMMRDEDSSLDDRGEDIHLWCEGFLVGFGTALQKEQREQLSGDAEEALADIVEISKLTTEDDDDPELESAIFEVSEYLRMAALMLFAEMNVGDVTGEQDPVLH